MIKVGSTELSNDEAMRIYADCLYVVNGSGVWQMMYSENAGFYGIRLVKRRGLTQKGRFYLMRVESVNTLLGRKVIGV